MEKLSSITLLTKFIIDSYRDDEYLKSRNEDLVFYVNESHIENIEDDIKWSYVYDYKDIENYPDDPFGVLGLPITIFKYGKIYDNRTYIFVSDAVDYIIVDTYPNDGNHNICFKVYSDKVYVLPCRIDNRIRVRIDDGFVVRDSLKYI